MKYQDRRTHEMHLQHLYRQAAVRCTCGYVGGTYETLDEILSDYRDHMRAEHARIR